MKVNVLFFGATADLMGTRRMQVEGPSDAVCGDMLERLVAEHPALSRHKLLIAKNAEYVGPDEKLSDGDELAIFTAVSGG
jgi:molybdopterin converting factor small subunit